MVAGFTVLNLAVNPAMTLTYDLIMSSAPAERSGTASGTAETGNELGIALGVAITGSIGAAVYRGPVPADVASQAARETLGGAVAAAEDLPDHLGAELLAPTRDAFTQGMRVTGVVLAVLLATVTVVVTTLLRGRADATG